MGSFWRTSLFVAVAADLPQRPNLKWEHASEFYLPCSRYFAIGSQ